MKTFITLLTFFILTISEGQQNKFKQAMLGSIEKMNSSETAEDFISAANSFERISQIETKEWTPLYYAAYSYIVVGFREKDLNKKDQYFDKAQKFIDAAFKIAPEESEIFALQAFLCPGKIIVDPMSRGMEYMGKMNLALDKAIQLNPDNPRSYYLRAISLLNLPESFGGGTTVAKPIFETAKQKFTNFKPKSALWPNWGKEQNESELNKL